MPDRQAVNRPDDYFIGHRRRGSGAYCPSVNFLNFPLNHIGDGCCCYPRLRALCRFWALTAPSGRCGTVGDLPLLCHNRWDAAGMRGPRCILGSSLHIFQHFHSKCERPWNLAPGTTVLRCRAAAPRITLL